MARAASVGSDHEPAGGSAPPGSASTLASTPASAVGDSGNVREKDPKLQNLQLGRIPALHSMFELHGDPQAANGAGSVGAQAANDRDASNMIRCMPPLYRLAPPIDSYPRP